MTKRPDGKRLMLAGKLGFMLGMALFLAGNFRAMWPSPLNQAPASELISLLGIGGTFLGPITWMVGYVVFAISFVRGRADP
jgi:hypothetical protein